MYAALLAAALAGACQLFGWAGVDLAAQVHRVNAFRSSGFSLWDFQWYGGHWTLDYSVLYAPLAALMGWRALTVVSAALAALAFDALAQRHFTRGAMVVSLVFAAGTLVQAAIGQLPFLLGESLGLCALWAASRNRAVFAGLLAFAASLSSPLAGAFAALAATAWIIGSRGTAGRRDRLVAAGAIVAGALAPIAATSILFPGQGPMPYPTIDWVWEMAVAAAIFLAAGKGEPVIRAGSALFALVATASVLVPTPLGGNIGRLEDIAALPLAIALLWRRPALLLGAVTVPLLLSQWTPAWGAVAASPGLASTHRSFFAPLDAVLRREESDRPSGRVEVVPTEYHWEADYVAQVMPLARGWERQLDVADNPIFYNQGALTAANYRRWLLDNGVQLVALPRTALDTAGVAEARLVSSGAVPGLDEIWSSPEWTLFRVVGSPGIVSGTARLVSTSDGSITVDASAAGAVTVRVRFNMDWTLEEGSGCVMSAPGEWILLQVPRAEQLKLSLSLDRAGSSRCSTRPADPASDRGSRAVGQTRLAGARVGTGAWPS